MNRKMTVAATILLILSLASIAFAAVEVKSEEISSLSLGVLLVQLIVIPLITYIYTSGQKRTDKKFEILFEKHDKFIERNDSTMKEIRDLAANKLDREDCRSCSAKEKNK